VITIARVKANLPAALTLIALVAALEIAVSVLGLWPVTLRAPSEIVSEIAGNPGLYWDHTWVTLYEVLVGFAISIVLGLVLAVGIAYSPQLQSTLYPIVLLLQIVPKVAIAPLLVIFMGFGAAPKILIVVLVAFFPIVIDTVVGLRQADRDMLDLVRSLNGSTWQEFTRVRFPNALPFIFGGLKVAITLAVIGAIIGEFVGADSGLGYLMIVANSQLQTEMSYAAVTILSAIGLVLYGLVALAEKLLVPWGHETHARAGV
jgi:NitT/TauT family transport system permease protein